MVRFTEGRRLVLMRCTGTGHRPASAASPRSAPSRAFTRLKPNASVSNERIPPLHHPPSRTNAPAPPEELGIPADAASRAAAWEMAGSPSVSPRRLRQQRGILHLQTPRCRSEISRLALKKKMKAPRNTSKGAFSTLRYGAILGHFLK